MSFLSSSPGTMGRPWERGPRPGAPYGNGFGNDPLSIFVANQEKNDKARKYLKDIVGNKKKHRGHDSSSDSDSDKP